MNKKNWVICLFLMAFFAVFANAGQTRVLRVTMNDGSTKLFMVKLVSKIAFTAVAASSSSVAASSSSEKATSSSSSIQTASSSSQKATSSSTVQTASSSSQKPTSSSTVQTASSSSQKATSSSTGKTNSSSSKKATSSSSGKESGIIATVERINHKFSWNARQQALLLFSAKATNAKVAVFDVQGVRLAKLNVTLVPGFNTVSLLDAHLANGKYVVHVNLDGESIHKVISIGNGK